MSALPLQKELDALCALCLTKYLSWKRRLSQHIKDTLFEKVQKITEIGIAGAFSPSFFFFFLVASQESP